jgi:hypothetical protein
MFIVYKLRDGKIEKSSKEHQQPTRFVAESCNSSTICAKSLECILGKIKKKLIF